MYVFKTEKGYVKLDAFKPLALADKKQATTFTCEETTLYGATIAANISHRFGCNTVDVEEVED